MIRQINDVDWQVRVTDAAGRGDYTITTSVGLRLRTAKLKVCLKPRGGSASYEEASDKI